MIPTNYFSLKELYSHFNEVKHNKEIFSQVNDDDIFVFDHNEQFGSYLDAEVLATLIPNTIYVFTNNGFYSKSVFDVLNIKVFDDQDEFWKSIKNSNTTFYYSNASLDSESKLNIPIDYKQQKVDTCLLHKTAELCKFIH